MKALIGLVLFAGFAYFLYKKGAFDSLIDKFKK